MFKSIVKWMKEFGKTKCPCCGSKNFERKTFKLPEPQWYERSSCNICNDCNYEWNGTPVRTIKEEHPEYKVCYRYTGSFDDVTNWTKMMKLMYIHYNGLKITKCRCGKIIRPLFLDEYEIDGYELFCSVECMQKVKEIDWKRRFQ